MRNRFQELDDAIQDLVERENPPILLVAMPDLQAVYLSKAVETRDKQDAANVYLLFTQPAGESAVAYVEAILAHLRTQLELANTTRVSSGLPPWPTLPEAATRARAPAPARLEQALVFARTLIEAPPENKLVAVFCPTEIESPFAYREALSALLPLGGAPPSPFFKAGKVVARDTPNEDLIAAFRKERSPWAMTYAPDLSPEAIANDMAEAANDPATPEAQRMEALVQLAALDLAHERLPEAIAKYELLYDYYARYEAPHMRAVVLSGVGDVLRRANNPVKAREKYGQALALALESKTLPLIASTATQVGDAAFELGQWDDALGHFEVARVAAEKLLNRPLVADLEERMGDVHLLKQDLGKAVLAWRKSADVARDIQYTERQQRALEKQAGAFASAQMNRELEACRAELAGLGSATAKGESVS